MRLAQIGAIYSGSGGETDQLVFDDEVITFDGSFIRTDTTGIGNALLQNHCIYKGGNTHLLCRMRHSGFASLPFVLSYYEGKGMDRPHLVSTDVGAGDPHSRLAGIFVGDKLHIVQEHPHDTSLYIYKANNDSDVYSFKKQVEEIGVSQSYAELFKLQDGTYRVYGQGVNSAKSTYVAGDSNFSNWGAEIEFAEPITVTNYPGSPINFMHSANGWLYFTLNDRQSGVAPFAWRKKYLIKTKDFDTFYNFTESFSKTYSVSGELTVAELNANFLYYNVGALDGLFPVIALDANENFYAISHDGVDTHVFIHWLQGQSAPTVVPISGISDMVLGSEGNMAQNSAIPMVLPLSESDVRIFVRRRPGTYAKIYQYKTNDLGQTWQALGDVLPGINSDIGNFTTVQNFADIPQNKTFIFAATQLLVNIEDESALYIRKAALGALQPESTPYTNPFTFAEFNALNGLMRSYFCESAFITRVNADVSALIDQSPVGQNANEDAAGFPQFASDDGEYISLNGVNQCFRIATPADLLALSEGTIFAVIKKDTAVVTSAQVLIASNTLTTTDRIMFGVHTASFNNSIIHQNTGTQINSSIFTTKGEDAIGAGWNILVWQLSDGKVSAQWINGKKQKWDREVSTGGTVNARTGYFFNKQNNLNVVDIGRLHRSNGQIFYDFKIKHLSIFNRPLTFDEINRATKFLADRYSIILNSHFQ